MRRAYHRSPRGRADPGQGALTTEESLKRMESGFRTMTSDPGTYALILRSPTNAAAQVGRWGRLELKQGYYIYVGSAFGPGGVRARVSRHVRRHKPRRWHLDYVREFLRPMSVWYTHDPRRLEHSWARLFSNMTGLSSIQGFGCSDCNCHSHLFYTRQEPDLHRFSNATDGDVRTWPCQHCG